MESLKNIYLFREIILPAIDIFIVSYLVYRVYLIIAETRAIAALKGILLIIVVTLAANFLGLETLAWLLERFLGVAAIALIVLFQPELRRVLTKVGQGGLLNIYLEDHPDYLKAIVESAEYMSKQGLGALIVFERRVGLKSYAETGTPLDSSVTFEFLVTLFTKDSLLHDGAVILQRERVVAAGCYLPLTTRRDLRKGYGTRHRAAIGLSEESDAVILVVSEETSEISLVFDGKIRADIRPEKLNEALVKALGAREKPRKKKK